MYPPALRLLIMLSLILAGSIFIHYQGFVSDLFRRPEIFGVQDGAYLSTLILKLQGAFNPADLNKAPFWQGFSGSGVYLVFLSEILQVTSTRSGASLSQILDSIRTLNLIALGLIVITLFLILDKEKVRPIFRLIPICVWLAVPVLQSSLLRIEADFWSLAFGLLGTFLYFQLDAKSTLGQVLIVFGFLSLGLILPGRLIALTPVLTCLLTAWLYGGRFAGHLFFLFLAGLFFPLIHTFYFHQPILATWKPEYFQWNFALDTAWPWWITFFALLWGGSAKLEIRQPALLFLLAGLIFSLWETGTQPDLRVSWIWTCTGACWFLGRSLQVRQIQKAAPTLSLVVLLLAGGVHFFWPGLFYRKTQSIPIIQQTQDWIGRTNQKKAGERSILSQDVTLNLRTQSPIYFNDAHQLTSSSQAFEEFKRKVKAHFFHSIILTDHPDRIWDPELVSLVRSEYLPVQKLVVLGEMGMLYEPVIRLKKRSRSRGTASLPAGEISRIFATF